MNRIGRLIMVMSCGLLALSTQAQTWLSPQARISLLTCTPGHELYSRYGHTALRVVDEPTHTDIVFNYGLFSFEDAHFYLHFVQGQTWYELGMEPYRAFMPEYVEEQRPVAEQVLNLSTEEVNQLFTSLLINADPAYCKYLYNFVFDNCATRPYQMIKRVLGDTILSDYQGWEGRSYRDFIHHYTKHGSWAEFGINLVFGYKADCPMYGEQRLFLPEELMGYLSQAYRPDGTPIVRTQQVTPFVITPVPWYQTWYFGMAMLAIVLAAVSWYDRRRGQRTKWVDYILYGVYVLLALLLVFLIFFSIHPLVSIGWRLFIIPAIHLCTRLIYIWH